MNLQTINDIDNEIKILYEKISKLKEKKILIRQDFPDAWKNTCNLYNNDEITDEYGY